MLSKVRQQPFQSENAYLQNMTGDGIDGRVWIRVTKRQAKVR